MNKNILKKIYYTLTKNIPWYEVNNDRNNKSKQVKIERKILDLLNPKSFKIIDTNYLSKTSEPITTLPAFMIINWPKGTDSSYFKSYEILDYYKDIGMIRFKLTLKNNISKEYTLKGFDTWKDILRQNEEQIEKYISSKEIMSYLSSIEFKTKLGKIDDKKFFQLLKPLYNEHFLKPETLLFEISSIDYRQNKYILNWTWTTDSKYSKNIEIISEYVKYLNNQKELLSKFAKTEIFKKIIKELDIENLKENDSINKSINDSLKDNYNLIYDYKNLKYEISSIDYLNNSIFLKITDKKLDIFDSFRYLNDILIDLTKEKERISSVILDINFLSQIKQLYISNKLSDKNEVSKVLSEYNIDNSKYNFIYIEHKILPFLIIQINNKNNSVVVTNNITLNSIYEKISNKDYSIFDIYSIIVNDLDFLNLIITNFIELRDKKNIFNFLVERYNQPWKDSLIKNPFNMRIEFNNLNPYIKIICIINGMQKEKILFDPKLIDQLKTNEFYDSLIKNDFFIEKIKSLSYDEINSDKNLTPDLLNNEELFNAGLLKDIEIKIEFLTPFNALNIKINNLNSNNVVIRKINIPNNTYKTILTLSKDISFLEKFSKYAQMWFDNLKDIQINENEIRKIIDENSNGISYRDIFFSKTNNDNNEIIFSINFKYLFPRIDIVIQKQKEEININSLINNLAVDLENLLADFNNLPKNSPFNLKDINSQLISDKYNLLNKYEDLTIKINDKTLDNNPLITFEISVPSLNISINSYTYYLPIIKETVNTFYNDLSEETKDKIKKELEKNPNLSYETNKVFYNENFNKISLQKWFRVSKISFLLEDNKIIILYNKNKIESVN